MRVALPTGALVALAVLVTLAPGAAAQDADVDRYEVHLERDHAEAEPQSSVDFPIVVENHGDTRLRFTVELLDPEGLPDGVQVTSPPPLELAPAEDGEASTGRTILTVFTPFRNGYVDERAEIALEVVPQDADDPGREGDPTIVTVTVDTRGFHVPAPGPLAVLTAAGIGAGVLGRRRR